MSVEFKIVEKEGWKLNPNDRVVNGIIRALGNNDGHCPCTHPERRGHDQCPCSEYLTYNNCFCNLYIKDEDAN